MRDKARENQLRRERRRGESGVTKTLGRPPSGGMTDRYTGLLTDDEWTFSQRVEEYKAQNKIRFLANSDILKMIREFGYRKELL